MAELIPLIVVIALFLLFRQRNKSIDSKIVEMVTLSRSADGALTVPVSVLESRGGFGAMTKNSLRPKFQIELEGLRFKIFLDTYLSFAEISEVDFQNGIFGHANLIFRHGGRTLLATLPNVGTAKAVLLALPVTIALSQKAARLREETTSV